MASVIRIKRRRTDDPAEALLLSQTKKSRTAPQAQGDLDVESVLEFAGTLDSKDESISKQIKEAIRRKKIHKQMHPHSSDFKLSLERTEITNRLRKQTTESSQNKRYRITCSRRALDIDKLDSDKECVENTKQEETATQTTDSNKDQLQNRLSCDEESKKAGDVSDSQKCSIGSDKEKPSSDNESGSTSNVTSLNGIGGATSTFSGGGGEGKEDEKIYCLIDVEHENQAATSSQSTASEITVNGIPMKSVKKATTADTKVPVMEESDDYVYDLYYTHTRLGHIRDEAVLTVEALCNEFLHDERGDEGDDFVYDDDDDSNDEGNWRNDYPDEDPHFFENAERDYDFQNNMRESNFDNGDDDEGDLLSYWMDTRCRIGKDVDCNDFEDDDYARNKSSSDEEAGAEMGYY